jgi:phage gp29-like protein
VAFKRGGIEFMMRFAERWGMPWIVGKARPNAPEKEKYAMRDALAGMVSDAVAVVSGGSDVQLVSAGGTAGDLHLSIVRHWDDAIAQVIAGQTLTSAVGENGSYAAAQTHAGILGEYTDADAVLVKTFFNELGWIYGQINARGTMAPTFVFDDPEDQGARAELGQKLHATGVRFTPVYYERKFGLADDEFTVADAAGVPAPAPAFAAPEDAPVKFTPGQQAIEELVEELLPQGLHASRAMTSVILKLVEQAETPEDLQTLLAQALQPKDAGGLDHSAFAGVVECALFAADMTGRFSARENIE